MIIVTPSDIRDAAYGLKIPSGTEADRAITGLIVKAMDRIEVRFPTIHDRIAAGTLPRERVSGVVEDMVIRVLRNPNAYRQVSIDDYLRQIDTAISSGQLYISDGEIALLSPSRKRRGFGSIRLRVPRHRWP